MVEAENLEAKDPNGYSDPFCMLGIRPGGCSGSPHVKSPREKSPCARQHRGYVVNFIFNNILDFFLFFRIYFFLFCNGLIMYIFQTFVK